MARKSTSTEGGASTATVDKPDGRKTRKRKSPKEKAETLTVRVLNALDALGYMSAKLTEPQRGAVVTAVKTKLADLDVTFGEVDEEESEEPEPFSLPD